MRMKQTVKTTGMIVWIVFLTLLVCVMSAAAISQAARANATETQWENTLRASLQEAVDTLRNVENDLSKLLITTDEAATRQELSAVALKSAACAQALSRLPIVATGVQNTLKFANQLSSYCVTALHSSVDLPEDLDERLAAFFTTCQSVNEELALVEAQMLAGELALTDVQKQTVPTEGLFGSIADDLLEYPAVIFDGPFSDGQAETTPKQTREDVSREQAEETVRSLGYSCPYTGLQEGAIPVYVFSDENATVQITRAGGLLYQILAANVPGEETIDEETAARTAQAFADALDRGTMRNVWREYGAGTVTFNFAPEENGVLYYPDLLKIKISLESGKVVSFEGRNYWVNHHERAPETPALTADEARARLKDGFAVETERLCVISSYQKEVLCREFFGTYRGMEYAVYFAASDGREVTSFRILSTETGKMVL